MMSIILFHSPMTTAMSDLSGAKKFSSRPFALERRPTDRSAMGPLTSVFCAVLNIANADDVLANRLVGRTHRRLLI